MSDLFSYSEEQNCSENNLNSSKEKEVTKKALTVTQLSNKLRLLIESNFSNFIVEGEISGLKKAASGHIYFDLKDDDSIIKCIVWRSQADRISCDLEDGMLVNISGKITTYSARSNYQIIVSSIKPAGVGALMKRFEEIKRKLELEGLFAEDIKKKIPLIPNKIGIITSSTGAVIEDMLHRIGDRFPSHIMFYPVTVQGSGAKEEISQALNYFNSLNNKPDVIIVARGGGSLEDLWAFNEEIVVRAIYNSSIPVISAVGHEPDITLCDFVADLRAPTPSAAAEMVVPVKDDLVYKIFTLKGNLKQSILNKLSINNKNLKLASQALGNPADLLNQSRLRLDDRADRFVNSFSQFTKLKKDKLNVLKERLNSKLLKRDINTLKIKLKEKEKFLISLSPAGVLKRGYVYLTDDNDNLVKKASELQEGKVNLNFVDDKLKVNINFKNIDKA